MLASTVIKDISPKKNSLEVEMHTGIPWVTGVLYGFSLSDTIPRITKCFIITY